MYAQDGIAQDGIAQDGIARASASLLQQCHLPYRNLKCNFVFDMGSSPFCMF